MIWANIGSVDRAWLESLAKIGTKISLDIEITHPRVFDKDNLYGSTKGIVDALVNLHYLAGDDPSRLNLTVTQQAGRDKVTMLSISEAK